MTGNVQSNMEIVIPENVLAILEKLNENGYEAYIVGGCVRDALLQREPGDWDITTSALPSEVKSLFRRTVDTGIQHGTVTVLMDKDGYEVTTYRIDGIYEDSRHPKEVLFTPNLVEDLKRRDFTINAMAYNPETGLVDVFDGKRDLEQKMIRCVGNPEERFSEDALRILRAVRFAAQLGFEIHNETMLAIQKMAYRLQNISKERIQVELDKLLISKEPWKIKLAYETGITKWILPEFDSMMKTNQNNPYHLYSVGEHTLRTLQATEADHYIRWAALLHDVGKPYVKTTDESGIDHFYGHEQKSYEIAKSILKNLKFDNKTIDIVSRMTASHGYSISLNKKAVRRSIYKIGEDIFPSLLLLKKADLAAKSPYAQERHKGEHDFIKQAYEEIIAEHECLSLKDLSVKGADLIELGIKPGRQIGEILDTLLDYVIDHPEANQKETLVEYIKEHVMR